MIIRLAPWTFVPSLLTAGDDLSVTLERFADLGDEVLGASDFVGDACVEVFVRRSELCPRIVPLNPSDGSVRLRRPPSGEFVLEREFLVFGPKVMHSTWRHPTEEPDARFLAPAVTVAAALEVDAPRFGSSGEQRGEQVRPEHDQHYSLHGCSVRRAFRWVPGVLPLASDASTGCRVW